MNRCEDCHDHRTQAVPDPPRIKQPSITVAPHLYEDGIYYPSAVNGPLLAPPSEADAPHLYEDGVCYPSTDGVPLPDGETQGFVFQAVVTTLRAHYARQPRTHVNGNTFIYYDRNNPRRSVSPDCYVALDVDVDVIDFHDNYRIWAMGKPPDFVLEIASQSTADNDLHPKRELYAYIGVEEYWRYDPTRGQRGTTGSGWLASCWLTANTNACPLETDAEGRRPRGYSPTLGLDLGLGRSNILRFLQPGNQRIGCATYAEDQRGTRLPSSQRAGRRAGRPHRR